MNNKLLFGMGWYDIEKDSNDSLFIWSGKESELYLIDNSIRCIELMFLADKYTSKELTIVHGKFEETYTLNDGLNSFKFYPDLSIKSKSKIVIKTPVPFCPSEKIINSSDKRELGQRLLSISIDGVDIKLSSIMSNARVFEVNPNIKINTLEIEGITTIHCSDDRNSVYDSKIDDLNPIKYNVISMPVKDEINDFISYYMLFKNIKNYSSNHIFLLNDNTVLIPDFKDYFLNFYTQVPVDWDVIYVGYNSGLNNNILINSKISKGTVEFSNAVILKNVSIPVILNSMLPTKESFNNQLKSIIDKHSLKSYIFTPSFTVL